MTKNFLSLIACIAASSSAFAGDVPVTPIDASRYVGVSRQVWIPDSGYDQQYDSYDFATPFGSETRSVFVEGEFGPVYQWGSARQSSSFLESYKLLAVESSVRLAPGQWSPGLRAQAGAGAISELSFRAQVDSWLVADITAQVHGTITSGATFAASFSASRDGVEAFNYTYATAGGGDYQDGVYQSIVLEPGLWDMTVRLSGAANAAATDGDTRYGDIFMFVGVTGSVPSVGGSAVLACAGVFTAVRRGRSRTSRA
jgi:hypothetical protein